MKAVWMVLVMCVSLIYVTGCGSISQTAFGHDGLPKEQYRVGGGLVIEYEAPQDGTFYLVDQKSGTFIATQSIDEGSTFDFSLPDVYYEDQYEDLTQSLVDGKLVLYFVPDPQEEEEQQ